MHIRFIYIFLVSIFFVCTVVSRQKYNDNEYLSYKNLRPYVNRPFRANPDTAISIYQKYTQNEETYFFYPMNVVNETRPLNLEYTRYAQNFENGLQKGHIFRVTNPRLRFSVLQPLGGCPGRVKTSVTARASSCVAASNAGFFDVPTGACIGNLITDGEFVQASDRLNVNIGTTKDGQYVIGYITEPELMKIQKYLSNLVQVIIWLIRNGQIFVNESRDIEEVYEEFLTLKAPRAAVGFDVAGNLLMIEVDGDEPTNGGLSLYDFASFLMSMKVYNAINIDGGGSTTLVKNYNIINFPSDKCGAPLFSNITERCERTVTTILCVHEEKS